MLAHGDAVPHVRVWATPREGPQQLVDVLGGGLLLLCFYVFDWSPT